MFQKELAMQVLANDFEDHVQKSQWLGVEIGLLSYIVPCRFEQRFDLQNGTNPVLTSCPA